MDIWFTSDLHLGHKNIIQFCKRPFSNVKEMDQALLENWNSLVKPGDKIFHVGDFTLNDSDFAKWYLKRLNGTKFILEGSHDRWMDVPEDIANAYYCHKIYTYESRKYGGEYYPKPIVLCHYPMRSWDRSHYGSWHLFGHHHGNLEPYGLSFDIGVDSHDFKPWNIDEVAEKMKTLKPIVDYSKG